MSFPDGLYIAYISGLHGQGVVFLVFRNHQVVGSDLVGSNFDGSITLDEPAGVHSFRIQVEQKPNIETVQGRMTGQSGDRYQLDFNVPLNYQPSSFVSVQTPTGPVNMRLEFLRDLGACEDEA